MTGDGELPSCWLVDIDGTVALRGDRGPFDWHRVGEDQPNTPVVTIVRALSSMPGQRIVFLSGRKEQCRRQTTLWLEANVFLGADLSPLFMRGDDDNRPDEVMKREVYEREIAPRYQVAGVIDDRAKVVAMWRSLGLTCAQVAEGNF